MDKKREIFSNNLRYYMKIKGITRQELADKTKISYFSIRDYEKGICYAKSDNIKKIAECLDIPIVKLTEEHGFEELMNVVDNSKNNKLMLKLMTELSKQSIEDDKLFLKFIDVWFKLSTEDKKYILTTGNMLSSKK